MSSPSKHYCFTLNNPPLPDQEYQRLFDDPLFSYACFQREIGANGTPHLQGYFEVTKRMRITGLKKIDFLKTAHFEKRRGTRQEARDYCSKDDTRAPDAAFWEKGALPVAQGKRSDLHDALAFLSNHRLSELATEFPAVYVKYHRGLAALANAVATWRDTAPEVHLLYGDPGSGKTRFAYESSSPSDLWVSPLGKSGWFDGYEGQPDVLIDDFAGRMSHTSLTDLLRILDRYTLQVPVKGGFVYFNPARIFVTTNYLPESWYDWATRGPQRRALARRFTHLHVFNLDSSPRVIQRGESSNPSDWPDEFYHFFLTQQ